MLTILHCADLHLEASFSTHLPAAVGNQRRAGLRTLLDRILRLAREHAADAVTIGGDLYEAAYAGADTAFFLQQAFAGIAPIRVYIAPGEADPYTQESLYAVTRWPGNVTVFAPGPLTPAKLAPDVTLWGAGYAPATLSEGVDGLVPAESGVNLLLLHAAAPGRPAGDLPQVSGTVLEAACIDLALLGHEHEALAQLEGQARFVYPGSPEPLAPSEAAGEHQVLLVTVDGEACTVHPLAVGQWRYANQRVDLSGCASPEDVTALVAASLRSGPGPIDERTILRLTCCSNRRLDLDREAIRQRVGAAYTHLCAQFPQTLDIEQIVAEPMVRGYLARRLRGRLEGLLSPAERATTQEALELALHALDGRRLRPHEAD